ncbi:hypothetical protein WR25_06775 isoform F [Diploscapter pachys]|uniref:Innexin n=1 Tax=Diploscapter pachys TaxID=2018661 RepID=A0A2A2J4E9_9BILA|nr:hypothetical protein WR25_06775 isoform F [Diploscapter pachys]
MYENIPDDHTAREEKQIGYYQWVPFILIAEALMFSLPCIFWRLLSWQSGLNIQHLINSACDTQALVDPSERNKAVEAISSCFIDNLDLQSPTGQEKSLLAYIKFFMIYGKASLGQNLDIFLESLFAILKYTVQCCLLINIINEKVFAFLWCWYLLLGAITTCSTIFWIMSMFIPSEKADYVLKFMQIAHSSDMKRSEKFKKGPQMERVYTVIPYAPHLLERFVGSFLKSDGIFILRMMANHAGDLIVVHIVRELWQEFRERHWREFEEFEEIKEHHWNKQRMYDMMQSS